MTDLRIATVHAGLSTPSTTEKLALALEAALVEAAGADGFRASTTQISLRNIAVKVTEATVSGVQSENVESALAAVTDADVLIAVSPTFNASYSGIFKSFFDLIPPGALEDKVTALGATGGTARHSLVIDMGLRPVFTYLRTRTVPTSVFASAEDFARGDSISRRAATVAAEALAFVRGSGAPSVQSFQADGTPVTNPPRSRAQERAHKTALADAGFGEGVSDAAVIDSPAGGFVSFSDIAKGFGK